MKPRYFPSPLASSNPPAASDVFACEHDLRQPGSSCTAHPSVCRPPPHSRGPVTLSWTSTSLTGTKGRSEQHKPRLRTPRYHSAALIARMMQGDSSIDGTFARLLRHLSSPARNCTGLGLKSHAVAHPERANSPTAALCSPAIGGHTHNSIMSAICF